MKKNWFYLFALICSVALFTACSDDDEPANLPVNTVNGTYPSTDGTNVLQLTYGDAVMSGKSVTFNSADGQTATITLSGAENALLSGLLSQSVKNPGVVPGEASTTLNVTLVPEGKTGYTFTGTDESNGRTLTYTGAIEAGKLTLDVDVTFADNNLQGTWNLFSSDDPWNTTYPIHAVWENDPQINIGGFLNVDLGWVLNVVVQLPLIGDDANKQSLNDMIAAVLQNVTFRNDGNIIASYSDAANVAAPSWQNSPLGMVQYCVKNDRIYVYLDIDTIIDALTTASTKADGDADLVGTLLTTLLGHINEIAPMLSEGISLGYTIDEATGMLSVYVDQNGLGAVLVDIVGELLSNETLMAALSEMMASNPDFSSFAPMMETVLPQLPAVVAGTTNLELGLNFNPATAAE